MCCYCSIEVRMSRFQRLQAFVPSLPSLHTTSVRSITLSEYASLTNPSYLRRYLKRIHRAFIVLWQLVLVTGEKCTPESRTPVIQLIGAMTPSQWVTSDSWTCFPSKLNTCTGAWVAPLVGSSINIFFDLCRPQIGSYKYIKDVQIQDK